MAPMQQPGPATLSPSPLITLLSPKAPVGIARHARLQTSPNAVSSGTNCSKCLKALDCCYSIDITETAGPLPAWPSVATMNLEEQRRPCFEMIDRAGEIAG